MNKALALTALALALSFVLHGCGGGCEDISCCPVPPEVSTNGDGKKKAETYSDKDGEADHFQLGLLRSLLTKRFVKDEKDDDKKDDKDKEKEDKNKAFEKGADKAAKAIKDASKAIKNLVNGKGNAGDLLTVYGSGVSLIPVWGPVLGAVLSLIGSFFDEQDPVIKELKEIEQELGSVQTEITSWCKTMIQELKLESCKSRYFDVHSTIRNSYQLLVSYQEDPSESTKQNFLRSCSGEGVCHHRLNDLLDALNGEAGITGCDLMDMFYQGDGAEIWQGSTKAFPAVIGYLILMASQGMQVETAFQTMQNKDPCAFHLVTHDFGEKMQNAINRFNKMLATVNDDAVVNARGAVDNYLAREGSQSKYFIATSLSRLLKQNYPDFANYVFVYNQPPPDNECRYGACCQYIFNKLDRRHTPHRKVFQGDQQVLVYFFPIDGLYCTTMHGDDKRKKLMMCEDLTPDYGVKQALWVYGDLVTTDMPLYAAHLPSVDDCPGGYAHLMTHVFFNAFMLFLNYDYYNVTHTRNNSLFHHDRLSAFGRMSGLGNDGGVFVSGNSNTSKQQRALVATQSDAPSYM